MATVSAGDVTLEYEEIGDGAPIVVLIHGASSSHRIWNAVQQELARDGMRTIAISMRGAGASDRSTDDGDYNPVSYARDIAAALHALEVGKFVLVGHSLGVSNALNFLKDHREGFEVDGVILMAGGAGMGRGELTDEQIKAVHERVRLPDPATEAERRKRWEPMHVGLSAETKDALWRDIQNNPIERMRGQALGPRPDMGDLLAEIDIPVLIVSGDSDSVVPLAMTLEMYPRLPANKRHIHVFHGLDHFPNAEAPDKVAGVYKRFIRNEVGEGALRS